MNTFMVMAVLWLVRMYLKKDKSINHTKGRTTLSGSAPNTLKIGTKIYNLCTFKVDRDGLNQTTAN